LCCAVFYPYKFTKNKKNKQKSMKEFLFFLEITGNLHIYKKADNSMFDIDSKARQS
jgi:hypothetical protein